MTISFFWVLMIMVPIMIAGTYVRYKFDRKYAMPVIRQSRTLSILWVGCVLTIIVACAMYVMGYHTLMFCTLLLLIPFVLYLNFTTYFRACKNMKEESKRNRRDWR